MADDKMQNDDFNPNEFSPQGDDIGGVNPDIDAADVTNPDVDMPVEHVIPDAGEQESDSQPADYNFSEIQGEQSGEVRIDANDMNNDPVTVRPVEFTPFDSYTPTNTDTNKNLELLMDIKLELTVELGRCQLPVKKVLELTRGSIIELDKVAGESVELFANGKHVANGEVVVIEDNFGLRITSITDPEERIKSL